MTLNVWAIAGVVLLGATIGGCAADGAGHDEEPAGDGDGAEANEEVGTTSDGLTVRGCTFYPTPIQRLSGDIVFYGRVKCSPARWVTYRHCVQRYTGASGWFTASCYPTTVSFWATPTLSPLGFGIYSNAPRGTYRAQLWIKDHGTSYGASRTL